MSELRFCDSGGLLVYARGRLSSDPCDYHLDVLQAPSGCNQMRCSRCGAMVRSGPPGRGLSRARTVTAAELYDAERWDALTASAPEVRLYACRCSLWESRSDAEPIDREGESANDPHMEWACAGHAAPRLPLSLEAIEVVAGADWPAIVSRVLGGECPRRLSPSGERAEGPSLWLGWLYAYLLGDPEAGPLAAAIAARVGDPDPLVRGRVLHFFMRFPRAEGSDLLMAEAARDPAQLTVGYAIPEHYAAPTLFDVVVARLESVRRRGEQDEQATEVLRKTMLAPPGSGGDVVEEALARFSSAFDDAALHQWIADHAVAIDEAAPGRWRAVMDLLSNWYQKPALGHLIVIGGIALIRKHAVGFADFREWIDQARARHRWVDGAWVEPLRTVLAEEEKKIVVA